MTETESRWLDKLWPPDPNRQEGEIRLKELDETYRNAHPEPIVLFKKNVIWPH